MFPPFAHTLPGHADQIEFEAESLTGRTTLLDQVFDLKRVMTSSYKLESENVEIKTTASKNQIKNDLESLVSSIPLGYPRQTIREARQVPENHHAYNVYEFEVLRDKRGHAEFLEISKSIGNPVVKDNRLLAGVLSSSNYGEFSKDDVSDLSSNGEGTTQDNKGKAGNEAKALEDFLGNYIPVDNNLLVATDQAVFELTLTIAIPEEKLLSLEVFINGQFVGMPEKNRYFLLDFHGDLVRSTCNGHPCDDCSVDKILPHHFAPFVEQAADMCRFGYKVVQNLNNPAWLEATYKDLKKRA